MVDLSFVIVSWNARARLIECIRSIAAIPASISREIIVVDNASDDGSANAVEKLFRGVTLIKNSGNLGFAKASNQGISKSSGKYVLLVNSDIIILNNCVERMRSYMESDNRAGMLGPRVLNADMTLQPTIRRTPSLSRSLLLAFGLNALMPGLETATHDGLKEVDGISGCMMMVRREAIDEVGLFDERFFIYAEDKDWCKRFRAAGWKIMYYPYAQAVHYGGASSSRAPVKFHIEMQRANLQFWEKHGGRLAREAYRHIAIIHQLVRIARSAPLMLVPSHRESAFFKLKKGVACAKWLLGKGGD